MVYRNYRSLKQSGKSSVAVSETLQPVVSKEEEIQIKAQESPVNVDDLVAEREQLYQDVLDIDELIADISTALAEKSAELDEEKEVPPEA